MHFKIIAYIATEDVVRNDVIQDGNYRTYKKVIKM